jgi:RNA polymerase sigma-70 factor (ECF subfamily)
VSTRNIEHLYRAHGADLISYLRRGFGRWAAPEDLLHETFVQALRNQDRLTQAASPRAWLFGIARHVGLTAARKHRHADSLTDLPQHRDERRPQIEAMLDAIASLPEVLRETMELRLREQLSYEEIAQVMQIPVGTVRSRLHTAMKKLREILEAKNQSEREP